MSSTLVLTPTQETPTLKLFTRLTSAATDRKTETIIFKDCPSGLGIKIIGGITGPDGRYYGVYVKRVLAGGQAAIDGRLQEGDQILEVNGQSLSQITNDRAVALLRQASASNYIQLLISRDDKARVEFAEVLDNYSGSHSSSSSVTDQQSVISDPGSTAGSASGRHISTSPGQHLASPDSYHSSTHKTQEAGESPEHSYVSSCDDDDDDDGMSSASIHSHSDITDPLTSQSLPPPPNLATPTTLLASLHHRGLRMIPAMTSTPHDRPQLTSTPQAVPGPSGFVRASVGTHSSGVEPSLVVPEPAVSHISDVSSQHSVAGSLAGSTADSMHGSMTQDSPRHMTMSPDAHRLSLDPQVRLRLEKLEVALHYLGVTPNAEEKEELHRRLHIDRDGSTTYGEFVRVAREIFKVQLQDRNIGAGAMYLASSDMRQLMEPASYRPQAGNTKESAHTQGAGALQEECSDLRREVQRLRTLLKEKENTCALAEEELLAVRQEAQAAIQENRALRSKVSLAEQAQRQARNMEHDYAEVVRLLETEVLDLRGQHEKSLESPAVQKRLALVGCQLKKAEESKKRYEVSTKKLLRFAETVHDNLSGPPDRSGKTKKMSTQSLAVESRNIIKVVRALMEDEPLPFGWDEAFTEDGLKYYVNHVTQMTSWTHPLSQVQHSAPRPAEGRQPPAHPTRRS